MSETFVKTTCTRDCPNTCGLIAHVESGRVVKLTGNKEHPENQGRCCMKCSHFLEHIYDKSRVMYPLKKIDGTFVRISWDAALDEIAERFRELVLDGKASSILYYQGFAARTALKLVNRRFFSLLGNTSLTKGTICGGAGQGSQDLDFGERISHDIQDYENSGSMILWGRNPVATGINLVPAITGIKKRGGTVVLVDPVDTQTAPLCSMHIRPRPGTDAYLAMALARILHENHAEDTVFLEKHCENYSVYKEMIFRFSVEACALACDVSVSEIYAVADILMKQKPVAFVLGWGLHRWEYAHTTLRSIDALGAVCGSIGRSGGGVSQGFEEYAPYDWDVWGDALQPNRRKLYMQLIGSEILSADPPIEAMMITAGNPVAMVPDANLTINALESIPFLVVAGHFLDDTGSLADIFLPVTTYLEEKDIVASYGHSFIGPLNPAIPHMGECKSDFEIFMELGKRFDFADEYVKTADEWLDIIMRPTIEKGISLKQIFDGGVFQPDVPHVPYTDFVFPTPSGKFRLMEEFEYPSYEPPEYPYRLMSVAPKEWLCSEITMEDQPELLPVFLSMQEGEKLQIAEGEICGVESPVGEIRCKVHLVEKQRSDLVVIPRGGWSLAGRNVNLLTLGIVTKVGGGTAYYETRVRLVKI